MITGSDIPLTVGDNATLTCSSDLDVNMVEWLYNGQVVVSSSGPQADLMFTPVNDSIHNTQYICRVTSPYGVQEYSSSISVTGKQLGYICCTDPYSFSWLSVLAVPPSTLGVSISTQGTAEAGEIFQITCKATNVAYIIAEPKILLTGPSGDLLASGNGITINSLVDSDIKTVEVYFNSLYTSDAGQYSCQVLLNSSALSSPLNKTATVTVTIQSKWLFVVFFCLFVLFCFYVVVAVVFCLFVFFFHPQLHIYRLTSHNSGTT